MDVRDAKHKKGSVIVMKASWVGGHFSEPHRWAGSGRKMEAYVFKKKEVGKIP